MAKLTDAHLEELDHEGFIIVPNFITGDQLTALQAVITLALLEKQYPGWDSDEYRRAAVGLG